MGKLSARDISARLAISSIEAAVCSMSMRAKSSPAAFSNGRIAGLRTRFTQVPICSSPRSSAARKGLPCMFGRPPYVQKPIAREGIGWRAARATAGGRYWSDTGCLTAGLSGCCSLPDGGGAGDHILRTLNNRNINHRAFELHRTKALREGSIISRDHAFGTLHFCAGGREFLIQHRYLQRVD